ncbi:MAG: hypothetical protein KatS3mg050_1762 [Litorilinea sp.]|nr:MAG: hypothetical protein KatS3mg050_1762 [Litorilinea sp.]
MSDVRLEHVTFRYGDVMAADDVTLHVREGEFFALLGPSGSGKTTILRLVAGFLQPQSGAITIGGRPVAGIPPYERHIGFVFQHYALFPHMTVAENVAFGLESRGVPRAEIRRRVSGGAGSGPADRAGRAPSGPAFRGATAAGGPGPGHCDPAPGFATG